MEGELALSLGGIKDEPILVEEIKMVDVPPFTGRIIKAEPVHPEEIKMVDEPIFPAATINDKSVHLDEMKMDDLGGLAITTKDSFNTALSPSSSLCSSRSNMNEKQLVLLEKLHKYDIAHTTEIGRCILLLTNQLKINHSKRASYKQGRIVIFGPPTRTPTIYRSLCNKYGMQDNFIVRTHDELKKTMEEYEAIGGEKSTWKYFIFMMNCDDGFELEELVCHLNVLRKYVQEMDRIDVFYCRALENTAQNYPTLNVLSQICESYHITARTLLYDCEPAVKEINEYVKSRYYSLVTGHFKHMYPH